MYRKQCIYRQVCILLKYKLRSWIKFAYNFIVSSILLSIFINVFQSIYNNTVICFENYIEILLSIKSLIFINIYK